MNAERRRQRRKFRHKANKTKARVLFYNMMKELQMVVPLTEAEEQEQRKVAFRDAQYVPLRMCTNQQLATLVRSCRRIGDLGKAAQRQMDFRYNDVFVKPSSMLNKVHELEYLIERSFNELRNEKFRLKKALDEVKFKEVRGESAERKKNAQKEEEV